MYSSLHLENQWSIIIKNQIISQDIDKNIKNTYIMI